MTFTEAKQAANTGKKVTHDYFTFDEYVTVIKGHLTDEKGYRLNWGEFWALRNSPSFQEGWSLFEEKK